MSSDARLVLERCDALAAVSSSATGIERVYLSPEHARVNAMAGEWMTQAGMTTWQDEAGNQRGRYEGTGTHIEYWDDTGFTADGDFVDADTLHHGGMVLRRRR